MNAIQLLIQRWGRINDGIDDTTKRSEVFTGICRILDIKVLHNMSGKIGIMTPDIWEQIMTKLFWKSH